MQKNSLKKNIKYNFIYQILVLILPFITTPYLSRTIGAKGIGTFSFSQSIAMYFTYITILGLSNYGNREIASVQSNKEERSKKFFQIYFMQLIMFTISISIYIIYIIVFASDKYALVIMIMWVISSMFDINWFFFGIEQFRLTVMRNCMIKIFTVASIFIFVKGSQDIYVYIGIMSFSTLLSQICLWFYLKKFVVFIKPTWSEVKQHFKPNFKLFIPVIAASIYNIMDKIMLGYMSNMNEVGYYENAEKIIKMIQSLIVAVGTVMLPRMTAIFSSNDNEEGNIYFEMSMNIVLMYVSASIFGILAIKDNFTSIYFGTGFEKTAILLGYLISNVFFFGIGNVLRTQYLIPKKKDKIFINSAILGAILNLLINIILIPKMNSIGAAIATIAAEASVCTYQFYMVRDEINVKKFIPKIILYLSIGFIMFCGVKNIPIIENKIIYLAVQVLCGICIFSILIIITEIPKILKKRKIDRV